MGKTYLEGEVLTASDLNQSISELVNTNGYFVFSGVVGSPVQPYVDPFSGLTVIPNPMTGEHIHNAPFTANGTFTVNTNPSYFKSQSYFSNTVTITRGDITSYYSNVTINYGNQIINNGNLTINNGYINTISGSISTSETVNDKIGHVRRIPINSINGSYTLVALDAGKVINMGPGVSTVTVNPNIFTSGDTITFWNGSNQNITIVQGGGFTMYWSGQNGYPTGNRLSLKGGFFSMVFLNSSSCVLSGSGLKSP